MIIIQHILSCRIESLWIIDLEDPSYRIIHQWANDYDDSTCKTYVRNICPDNPETVNVKPRAFLECFTCGIL